MHSDTHTKHILVSVHAWVGRCGCIRVGRRPTMDLVQKKYNKNRFHFHHNEFYHVTFERMEEKKWILSRRLTDFKFDVFIFFYQKKKKKEKESCCRELIPFWNFLCVDSFRDITLLCHTCTHTTTHIDRHTQKIHAHTYL